MAEVQNKEEIVILRLDPVDIFITFQINEEQDVRVENALLTDVPGLTKESIQGVIGHCQKVAETEDIRILNILRLDRPDSVKPEVSRVHVPFGKN